MHSHSSRGQPPPRKHGRPSEPPTEQGNGGGHTKKKAKYRHDRITDPADVAMEDFSNEQPGAQAEVGGSRLRYDINARFNFSGVYPPDGLDHDDQGFRIKGAAQNASPARPVFPDRNLGERPPGHRSAEFQQRSEGIPPFEDREQAIGLQEIVDRDRRERHMGSPTRTKSSCTPDREHPPSDKAYHGHSGGRSSNYGHFYRSHRHTTRAPAHGPPRETFEPRTPARLHGGSFGNHSQSSPLQNGQNRGRSARRNKRRPRRRRTAVIPGDTAEDSTPASAHEHERLDVPINGDEENDEQSQDSLSRESTTPKPQKRKKRSSAQGHSALPSQHPRDHLQRIRPDDTYVVTHSTGGDNRHKMWYYCTDHERTDRNAIIQAIDDNAPINKVLYTSQLIPANRLPRGCPPHPWDLSSPILQSLRKLWRRADWNRVEVFKYINLAADTLYSWEGENATITDSDLDWAYDKMGKDYAVLEAGL